MWERWYIQDVQVKDARLRIGGDACSYKGEHPASAFFGMMKTVPHDREIIKKIKEILPETW